ncbi:MAG: hypothetical protein ACKVS9_15400 [Phycisphaerae bacterium]
MPGEGNSNLAVYLELRKQTYEHYCKQADNLSKALLTLSSALLGISLAFVKEIVRPEVPTCKYVLVLAWLSLGASMAAALLSMRASARSSEHFQQILDECASSLDDSFCVRARTRQLQDPDYNRIDFLDRTAGVAFAIGLVLLCIFVVVNV